MKRPAAYLRVSTLDQKKRETIKTQKDGLVDFFKSEGLSPQEVLWYLDEAVSGTIGFDNRGNSARLLEDAEAEKIEYLAVYSMSRLSRSEEYDIFTLFVKLRSLDIPVRSISEGVDTDAEGGMFMAELLGLLAIQERRKLKKILKAGLIRKSREGRYYGRAPIGYRRNADDFLEIDEEAAPYIRLIYQMYVEEKKGGKQIADHLITLGTPYSWDQTKIGYILKNPVYSGKAYYNKTRRLPGGGRDMRSKSEWIEIVTPAIIDEVTFKAAQRIRQQSINYHTGDANRLFLLSVVKCGHCGASYTRTYTRLRYYKHSGKYKAPCDFRYRHIQADSLEPAIWARIEQAILSPEDWKEYIGQSSGDNREALAQDLIMMKANIKKIAKKQEKIDRAYYDRESISDEHYDQLTMKNSEQSEEIKIRIDKLEARLISEQVQQEREDEIEEILREFQSCGLLANIQERRELTDALIDKVVIEFDDNKEMIVTTHWLA